MAELPTFKKTLEWDSVGCVSHGETVRVGCILDHLYRVSRRPLFPGHVLFSPDMSSFRDLKNASGRDSKNVRDFASSDICVSLGLSQTSYYALTSFGKGISWLDYTTDCVWPRSCIDGLVLVYSSPRVVRFAKQFPARTLGGVTLFVEDDRQSSLTVYLPSTSRGQR